MSADIEKPEGTTQVAPRLSFLREVFSEPVATGSTGSASRVVMGFFALAAVGWVSYLVIKTHVIPNLLEIAGFVSSPYLVNQAKASIADFKK
jgi:hypothetical protein